MSTEKTIIDKIKALFVEPEVKLATETLDEGAATLEAEALLLTKTKEFLYELENIN